MKYKLFDTVTLRDTHQELNDKDATVVGEAGPGKYIVLLGQRVFKGWIAVVVLESQMKMSVPSIGDTCVDYVRN